MPGDWIKEAEAVNDNHWLNDAEEIQPEPSFLQKYGESFVRPTLQGLGAVGGGLVGTAAGPVGTVGGAGAGYAAGEQIYKTLMDLTGNRDPESVGKRLGDTATDVLTGATMEMGGQALSKAATNAISSLPKIATKASKALYDIPEKAAKHIASNPERVKAAMQETNYSGGNKLIDTINQAIDKKTSNLNAGLNIQINKADMAGKEADISRTLGVLNKAREKMGLAATQNRQAEINDLQKQIDLLDAYRKTKGTRLSLKDANDLKRQLQDIGFVRDPNTGLKIYRKDDVGDAVRKASRVLRQEIETQAPGVKEYNEGLKKILDFETDNKFQQAFNKKNIENTMKSLQSETNNKGYIKELVDKADTELGTNIRNTTDDFFAAKYLRDPDSGSAYKTGRSVLPSVFGAGVGGAIAGPTGAAVGAAAGPIIASPQVFKAIAPRARALQQGIEAIGTGEDARSLYRALPYVISRKNWEDEQ